MDDIGYPHFSNPPYLSISLSIYIYIHRHYGRQTDQPGPQVPTISRPRVAKVGGYFLSFFKANLRKDLGEPWTVRYVKRLKSTFAIPDANYGAGI